MQVYNPDESLETVIRNPSFAEEHSGDVESVSQDVSQELVAESLLKQGLSEVVYSNDDEHPGISTDYFLRLVNCQT